MNTNIRLVVPSWISAKVAYIAKRLGLTQPAIYLLIIKAYLGRFDLETTVESLAAYADMEIHREISDQAMSPKE